MGHTDLTVIDDGHLGNLVLVIGIHLADLVLEPAVNLLYNLVDSRQQAGEQLNGPLLQSLRHNRMVGIGTGLGGHIPGLIPAQIIVVQKNPHQLCHCHGWMGVIELEHILLVELAHILVLLHILGHCTLHTGGDKEILLL